MALVLTVTFYDYWSKLYELKPFDDIGRASITIRQRHMIELLKDIRPQPLHMAQMIFKTGSCKRLSDALKSGLLGSNWITDLNKIIQTFSHWYLGKYSQIRCRTRSLAYIVAYIVFE